METWWERRRGWLPWEMLRLWWIGAMHASATCRVNEEWRPSSSLDCGEGEGEHVVSDDGGGKASWHGLQVSPLWLVQSSEHWSWMLGWDKLQSSREGSTLKSQECPELLQVRKTYNNTTNKTSEQTKKIHDVLHTSSCHVYVPLCYQTFVSRMGSGYISTVTEWLSGASPGSPWRSIDVGSICTVTRLGPGGRAAVLGQCSITATQSSSSKALCKSNKSVRTTLC